ncbi:YtpI family protein [Paenibacillus eucommiae]|uniref:Membrane protein YfcA n=1 Tax=Paenibacillus eucommiae TaxID=1355755 RepID=A0ABS4J098_9BACL|nr:YtpI family protein [Paenibacillus eucommiae]MBP1993267.1 putative membrane protein YfcA [Paenibacillus eucommiae]
MFEKIQLILSTFIVIALACSFYFSFRSRKEKNPNKRGLYLSKMNIFLGIMLLLIAITQLFFFTDSNLRRIFGIVCFLLGFFNLFSGIRSNGIYRRLRDQ